MCTVHDTQSILILTFFLILGSNDASSFKSKSIVISNMKYLSKKKKRLGQVYMLDDKLTSL